MPETACLHIQARDSDPIRVVEIPGTSVRIGRASFCEVRLSEPDIADEECRLRRKGGQWQLVPSRSAGFVWIDGRSVEETCPIAFGVPFRVGEHWLTLRPNGSAPTWRDYQAPLPTASAGLLEDIRAERHRQRDEPGDAPRPSTPRPPASDDQDHLSRWKDRQDELANRARVGQQERRWEERWRAAGERLRARSTTAVPPRTAETRVPPTASYRSPTVGTAEFRDQTRRHAASTAPLRAAPAAEAPPIPAPLVPAVPLDRFAPPPFPAPEPLRLAPPPPAASVDSVPSADWLLTSTRSPFELSPMGESPTQSAVAVEVEVDAPPFLSIETLPQAAPPAIDDDREPPVVLDPTADVDASPAPEPSAAPALLIPLPVEPEPTLPELPDEPPAAIAAPSESEADPIVPSVQEQPVAVPEPVAAVELRAEPPPVDAPALPAEEPPAAKVVPPPAEEAEPRRRYSEAPFVTDTYQARAGHPNVAPPRPDFSTTVHDVGVSPQRPAPPTKRPATRPERPAAPQPGPTARTESRKTSTGRGRDSGRDSERRGGDASSRRANGPTEPCREWPTVRDILDAHRAEAARASAPRPSVRTSSTEPMPTLAVEPNCWSAPLWLAWLPSLALLLGAGTIGLALAWIWSVDTRTAGAVANLLAQGTAEVKPLPPSVVPPDGSWWKSTAPNLMQWALYFDRRSNAELENAEKALELLQTAAKASPVQPQVRFALSRRPTDDNEQPSLLESSFGLSRDVVSLSWSGHQWLKAGKKDAALKRYRAALEMASRAELRRLATPGFDDDPQIKRYRLPGEDMIGMVVRDMADHEGWTFAEWSEALPPFALVPLTAARLLRERGSPDSEKALDAIVAKIDVPAPERCSAPLHMAAQAEALALKLQWAPAEARYREAIAAMPDDAVRRSWWINLADIVLKLNDEPGRQKALELAKGNDANDEIALRAIEVLKYSIVRPEKPRAAR